MRPKKIDAKLLKGSTNRRFYAVFSIVVCTLAGCEAQHPSGTMAVDAPAPAKPTIVAAREFTSVAAIFDVTPTAVRPGPSGDWTPLKIDAANGVLKREVLGHRARIEGQVRTVGVAPGTFNRRYAGLPRVQLGEPAIDEIPVTLYGYFPAGSKEQVAAINPGDRIVANGAISRAEITREPNGHGVRLNIDLMDCRSGK